jgi:twitching motility protein PilT
MKKIDEMLKASAAQGASDLHLKVGSPPIMRINGKLVPFPNAERVSYDETLKISLEVMTEEQRDVFKSEKDVDFAYSIPGLGRFRANVYLQRGAVGLVFRLIPIKIPTIDELGLPPVLKKIALEERGLILVTGTTGSGKSTTLAAMVEHINSNKTANVITIEDPIEYLHRDKKGVVNQREIGMDTKGFGVALRAALRQDPDVILLGEMRDVETIETAMVAAETGHLVLSTLHTIDATETVNRIVAVFPPHQHQQARIQLAAILKGIISMRLVPKADGSGRVPALEVLLATTLIRQCILDPEKTKLIPDAIVQGRLHYGMQTFDQALTEHYSAGRITYGEALKWATNPEDFKLKAKGIHSTSDLAFEGRDKGSKTEDIQIDRFQK